VRIGYHMPGKNIIVVTDDWRGIRRHFSQLESHNTIYVTDTKHAQQLCKRTKPDAIILDENHHLSFKTSCQTFAFRKKDQGVTQFSL
jgi:DNA-binding response OmpR family regulator